MRFLRPRLRVPAALAAGGTVIAAVILVGQGIAAAIPIEVVFVALAASYYVWAGRTRTWAR